MSRIRCTNNWICIWLPPRELFLSNIAFPVAPLHINPFAHSWKNMQMEWMVFVWGDALSSQFDQLNFLIRLSWLRHGWSHLPVPNVRCSNSIRLSWLGFHLDHLGAGIPGHSLARWDSAWSSSRSVYWGSRCFRFFALVPSLVPKTWP